MGIPVISIFRKWDYIEKTFRSFANYNTYIKHILLEHMTLLLDHYNVYLRREFCER